MQKIKSLLFENKTLRQTVFKNTFWMAFGHTMGRLIRAVLIIYAARILGVAGYGVFSYALALSGFFAVFADIGLTPFLTRESARNPEARREYISTALFIKFVFIVVSSLLIIFGAPLIARLEGAKALFPIIVFLFAFDTLRDFFFGVTRSLEKMELEAGINILTNAAILIFGGAALILVPASKTLTLGYTIGSGIGLFTLIFVLREHLKRIWSAFNPALIKQILSEAWPFALSALLGTIMLNTDMLMLGWFRNAAEVGFYSAAQKIILLTYLLPGFLAVSLFPSFARLAGKDNERFRLIFENGLKILMLIAFPIAVGGILLAPKIISFLYGVSYLPASPAFTILLLTPLLTFPGVLISNAIFAYNRQRAFIGFVALGAGANIIANFLLIPPYGILGAAFATLIAQAVANAFTWSALKKAVDFRILAHLPKIITASLLTAIFVFFMSEINLHVLFVIFAAIVVYLAALRLLKEPALEKIKPASFYN